MREIRSAVRSGGAENRLKEKEKTTRLADAAPVETNRRRVPADDAVAALMWRHSRASWVRKKVSVPEI